MNVMAMAHKIVRETLIQCPRHGLVYANLLKAALKDYHRINKEQQAMKSL